MSTDTAGAISLRGPGALAESGPMRPQRRLQAAQGRAGFAMTVPFLALFAVFFAGPLVYSVVLSLRSPLTNAFTGFLNYRTVFHNGEYWSGVTRMLYFGAIQVSIMIGLAIGLALFLDSPYCRGRRLFALVYFIPFAVPGVIAAIMWGFLLQPDLNSALKVPHDLGLASGAINPLDYRLSLYAIMLIVTWEFTGYNMTILLTSLTNVPHQVIEAAKVDGCSELSIAARIKLPLIRRTVIFIVILSIIGTLQLFNEPVILNNIASIGNSFTPNQIIYNTAFSFGNEQLAAAQSVVLAAITIVATVIFFTAVRRKMDPFAVTRGR
ncbi:MAG TPA: sugar ABC transporter permease [Acidimicrobiales bacterium]|nr:sugar ABC transporter permease [Acidimicrobiales bacterium]